MVLSQQAEKQKVFNVNVGVLGHVDSGKTSLVAALSTKLSTAALDKHPQSKERGITLDLGFSSFTLEPQPGQERLQCKAIQVTLVDCPGHASLVRTILGGAQIMDMMLLVVDVTKGIQKQTAECLVVGEMTTDKLIIVLNKVDLLPDASKDKLIAKAGKMLLKTFAFTKFKDPPIIALSAKRENEAPTTAMEALKEKVLGMIPNQPRQNTGPFLMSVDHCFAVRGHGTVMTGTVLQGSLRVNDVVEIPHLKEQRKVKSMQMFHMPQQACSQGDRVGVCVTQLDPSKMERGWLCSPGTVQTFSAAIASVEKIKFYTGEVRSKQKLHITIGHSTVMADIDFFGLPEGIFAQRPETSFGNDAQATAFDESRDYLHQDQLYGMEGRPAQSQQPGSQQAGIHFGQQWCLLRFSQPVIGPKAALLIGSKLDDSSAGQSCRLAMHGRIEKTLDQADAKALSFLRVYKLKSKQGSIERILPDGRTAVCKGFFKKESDYTVFKGMKVRAASGAIGILQGNFGTSGKVKVQFAETLPRLSAENSSLVLEFKKYIYGSHKRIAQ